MKEKSYIIWFKPISEDHAPARYHIIIVRSNDDTHYSAYIIAGNLDTPKPQGETNQHWIIGGNNDLDELCQKVDNNIMALNPKKEAKYEGQRFSK